MIHLYLTIRSKLGEYFKPLGSLYGNISENWAWELDHHYYSGTLLELQLQTEGLFRIGIGILGYCVDFSVYNKNHDCWR